MEPTAAAERSDCFPSGTATGVGKTGGILDDIREVKHVNNLVETELDWDSGGLGCGVSLGTIIAQLQVFFPCFLPPASLPSRLPSLLLLNVS